jgi:hypothetical protein
MSEEKTKKCVEKLFEITKDDYTGFLFFCVGAKDGFAVLTAKEEKDHARLMAQITESLVSNSELHSMMKAIMTKVNEIKGVN